MSLHASELDIVLEGWTVGHGMFQSMGNYSKYLMKAFEIGDTVTYSVANKIKRKSFVQQNLVILPGKSGEQAWFVQAMEGSTLIEMLGLEVQMTRMVLTEKTRKWKL